jgi:hypothetical protein
MKPILLSLTLAGLSSALPSSGPQQLRASWPNGPLITSGRWIHDASGSNVTYAGANWPGAADVMIPEGLQYQSVATIVSMIKSTGMNTIRLTYAIQMIDEIYSNGGKDVTIYKAFTQALGATNGAAVFAQVLAKNPTFSNKTTRLDVSVLVYPCIARPESTLLETTHCRMASISNHKKMNCHWCSILTVLTTK